MRYSCLVAPLAGCADRNAFLFLAVPSVFMPHFFVKCVDRNVVPNHLTEQCAAVAPIVGCVDRKTCATGSATDAVLSRPARGARIEMIMKACAR